MKIFEKLIFPKFCLSIGTEKGVTGSHTLFNQNAIIVRAANDLTITEETTLTVATSASNATGIDSATRASTVFNSASSNYLKAQPFTVNSGNCYYSDSGADKNVLRVGKSGNSASLTIELASSVSVSQIILNCYTSGSKNVGGKISVNSATSQTVPEETGDLTFSFDGSSISSITLDSEKMVYIKYITVVPSNDDDEPSDESAHAVFANLGTETSLAVSYNSTTVGDGVEVSYLPSDFSGIGASGGGTSGSINLDGFSFEGTSCYGADESLRLYQSSTLTISYSSPITKIVMTSGTGSNSIKNLTSNVGDIVKDGETTLTWTGSSNTVVFTASAQTRVKSISIESGEPPVTTYSYNDVALRFGIPYNLFSSTLYANLQEEAIDDAIEKDIDEPSLSYGVAICKGESWDEVSAKFGTKDYAPVGKDTNNDGEDDCYQFAMVLKGITNYSQKYIARAFVEINGTKYYAKASTAYSVNSIAADYIAKKSSDPAVSSHLDMLNDLKTASYQA